MRDLMALGAVTILVILGFRNAFVAYMSWAWTAVMALNTYMFGFMAGVGLNQIFAIMTLVHVFLGTDKQRQPFRWNRTSILVTLLAFQGLVAATFAYPNFTRNWEYCGDLFKLLAFCLVMPLLATTRLRTHALVLVLALGMSFHGLLDGLKLIASGGGHLARGVVKFGDNNHSAVMFAMAIPLTYFLAQYSTRRAVRNGFIALSLLSVLAVVATHSRGGLLCIAAIGFWLVKNSRRKAASMVVVLAGAVAVVAMAPASWTERMSTVKEADEDGSFMGRVMAWKRSSAMAMEHPLVGAGLGAAGERSIYWKFAYEEGFLGFVKTPPPDGIPFVAHSIYFQVLGDMGFVGFFLFAAILVNAFLTRNEIRRRIGPSPGNLAWAGDLADMLAVSVAVFAIGGALVAIAYQEFFYMIVMLLEVLKQLVIRESVPAPAEPVFARAIAMP